MCKYQKTHGDLKKEVLPMTVKEHPELDDSPFLNEKEHNNFQHVIGVCQRLIISVIFDLAYAVTSFSRFLDAPRVCHIDPSRRIFCYLKKHPKRGCTINPQLLTIDADYDKVQMNHDFGNQYAYFSEYMYYYFSEPLLDELYIHVYMDANHGYDKVTGRSKTISFVVLSTTTTW